MITLLMISAEKNHGGGNCNSGSHVAEVEARDREASRQAPKKFQDELRVFPTRQLLD